MLTPAERQFHRHAGATASAQCADSPFTGPIYDQAEDLLRDADIAMYQAKSRAKACYAIFDSEALTIEFHRVPYEIKAAQKAILDNKLPERLATRLSEGR